MNVGDPVKFQMYFYFESNVKFKAKSYKRQ